MLKRIFRTTVCLMTAIGCLCTGVHAAQINIEETEVSGKFVVEGTVDSNTKTPVVIHVFRQTDNDDWVYLPLNSLERHVVFHDQGMTDAEKTYQFTVNVQGKSEAYVAYLFANGQLLGSRTFSFCNLEELKEGIRKLTEVAQDSGKTEDEKIAGMVSLLDTYQKALGISFAPYKNMEALGHDSLARLLYNNLLKNGELLNLVNTNEEDAKQQIASYAVMDALNHKKIENVFDYASELRFGTGAIKNWYKQKVVDNNMQLKITAAISQKNLQEINDFQDKLLEALILNVVAEPDGWGTVEEIMTEFESFLGIDASQGSQAIYQGLTGNTYATTDDLRTAFYSLLGTGSGTPVINNGGVGGFGGAGGAGGFGGAVAIKDEILPDRVVEPIQTEDKTEQPVQFRDCNDVPWATEAILALAERKILAGKDEYTFDPNGAITREEFVKIVVEAFDIEQQGGQFAFQDVASDGWYYPYLLAAYSNGIIKGISEDLFGVGSPITRQDICTILYHVLDAQNIELQKKASHKNFSDSSAIADYAKEAVAVMQESGIVTGFENDLFLPGNQATRAEAAVLIHRLLLSIEQ